MLSDYRDITEKTRGNDTEGKERRDRARGVALRR